MDDMADSGSQRQVGSVCEQGDAGAFGDAPDVGRAGVAGRLLGGEWNFIHICAYAAAGCASRAGSFGERFGKYLCRARRVEEHVGDGCCAR